MIRNLIRTVVLLTAMASTASYAAPIVEESKALVIDGVIARGNILPLGKEMLVRAARGDAEVQLIINSPGGEVMTGFLFLNLMRAAQAQGLRVVCFVPTLAASMAYQILLNCDERHTLNHSFLLWHRARVNMGGMFGKPMTGPELLQLGADLSSTDATIFQEVLKFMGGKGLSTEELFYHFNAETLHVGVNLHMMVPEFITSHDSIEGLFEALLSKKIPRNEVLDISKLNIIIYMTTKAGY